MPTTRLRISRTSSAPRRRRWTKPISPWGPPGVRVLMAPRCTATRSLRSRAGRGRRAGRGAPARLRLCPGPGLLPWPSSGPSWSPWPWGWPSGLALGLALGSGLRLGADGEALEPADDAACVLEAVGADAVAHLARVVRRQVGQREVAALLHPVQAYAGQVGLDPAEDRDLVAVVGHVVLALGPGVAGHRDDGDQQGHQDQGAEPARHGEPARGPRRVARLLRVEVARRPTRSRSPARARPCRRRGRNGPSRCRDGGRPRPRRPRPSGR